MSRRGLIFDFDGVLADTERLHWKAWAQLLKPVGIDLSWEDYCRHGLGISDRQMLVRVFEVAGRPDATPDLDQILLQRSEIIQGWFAERSPISPATVHMLKGLNGYPIGLVTSSARIDVEPLLRSVGIFDLFQAFVFGEDVIRLKPDPEPYLLIKTRLALNSGIAFEDSDAGILSAAAAGFDVVRVAHPDLLPAIVRQNVPQRFLNHSD